ncbi:aminodeoxychorismate synthase component I [Marinimicrobium sp. ABcell2]|uniref:aminodeoxychorismate synthase component I n=1 Tax=Marinimicrobium sp. ABcell2 TaxID=3069751 RepID=UPI0027AF15D8|nr:aminodeoxychorismate synthase component I [Marinimicrobium sp. ABcell2]MDQ2078519.1 aminodeoxychorismate synthase component I [Marinimicrobium sp. ABcell2]
MLPAPRVQAINYQPDSKLLFRAVAHLPHPVWLDSGRPGSSYGRYDIISASPNKRLITHGDETRIESDQGEGFTSKENPFQLLQAHMPDPLAPVPGLPFVSGAIGYFGYDLGRRLEQLPSLARSDINLPDMCVAIYPWALVQDHETQQAWLVSRPDWDLEDVYPLVAVEHLKSLLIKTELPFKINSFQADLNVTEYANCVTRIQDYIRSGDCYQVNYAQRFSADYQGDPATAYLALREALPSPFSGYIPLDQGAVLSLSPERFVRLQNGLAEAKPIKGTIARGATPEQDQANAQTLSASQKDRAENLMIVDLLRNDLSKTCEQVAVPKLFELQSFANVHHLVSTVTGKLKPDTDALDLLAGCFPGGSITGAPKIRAMEIIEELEPTRRSVYCGSLGYISADGNMDTSIAIRSLVCDQGRMHCWGGGGIVADSEPEKEYQESLKKVQLLMDTLERTFGGG